MTMIGTRASIVEEERRVNAISALIGIDNSTRIVRGPLFAPARADGVTTGALLLETAGACWALPEVSRALRTHVPAAM